MQVPLGARETEEAGGNDETPECVNVLGEKLKKLIEVCGGSSKKAEGVTEAKSFAKLNTWTGKALDTSSEVLRENGARGPKALVEERFSRLARNIVDINEYWRGGIQQVDDNIEFRFRITSGLKFRNDM